MSPGDIFDRDGQRWICVSTLGRDESFQAHVVVEGSLAHRLAENEISAKTRHSLSKPS